MIGGPCPSCGDDLALDQRYCISCGHRVESPMVPTYHPGSLDGFGERGEVRRGFPMPIPIAGVFAAVALGFGVVMGTAISPNLSDLVAADRDADPVVVQVPPEEPEPDTGGKPKGGGGGSGSTGSTSIPSYGSTGDGFYGSTGSTYYPDDSDTGTGGVGADQTRPDKPKPVYNYFSGTVVHKNPVAGSYTVASSSGELRAIHTKKLPSIGAKLKVPVRKLANGTYAEDAGRQNKGQAATARFTGVVTDSRDGLDANQPDVYTVSARGASILVFAHDLTGFTASPIVGEPITTSVEIKAAEPTVFPPALPAGACPVPTPGFPRPAIFPAKQLWQTGAPARTPTPVTSAVIETTVQSTCPASAVFSTDDIRYGNSDVELLAAPGVNPALLLPGEALMAQVTIAGGALTSVTGTASDSGIKGADDSKDSQGNIANAAAKTDARIASAAEKHARR